MSLLSYRSWRCHLLRGVFLHFLVVKESVFRNRRYQRSGQEAESKVPNGLGALKFAIWSHGPLSEAKFGAVEVRSCKGAYCEQDYLGYPKIGTPMLLASTTTRPGPVPPMLLL
jgi:hypothetical protein